MKLKSFIRWYKLYDKKKLNLKTLNESTDKFEALLKKYGEQEPEVQDLYESFEPLFQQIRNGEITKPKEDNFRAGTRRYMYETPPIAQFSDLLVAYSKFRVDICGNRENPLYGKDGPVAYMFIDDDKERIKKTTEKIRKDFAEADHKEREERKKKKENQSNN